MTERDNSDRAVTTLCFAAAAILLGVALSLNGGFYSDRAILLVTVVCLLCITAVLLRKVRREGAGFQRLAPVVLIAGLGYQGYRLFLDAPSRWAVLVMLGSVAAVMVLKTQTLKIWWVSLALVIALVTAHCLIGAAAIRSLANPNFDVYWFHQHSLEALMNGVNPHTLTVEARPSDLAKYPASYVRDGVVHIGFPYPPLSLFLALPGYLIAGDYRYSGLAATALAGGLMVFARRSRASFLATALFLSTPAMIPMVRMGWTEPFVVLLFGLTVFSACRAPRLLPWALGLLIAVKQYAIFAALSVFLLPIERNTLKNYAVLIGKALALAIAVTLPWMLWNVSGFLNDVVRFQFLVPFRWDALSYLVWLGYKTGAEPPALFGFIAVPLAVALMLWRGARTPAGYAASVAFTFLAFFAFNKLAFINYYFFVIGAMCFAVALAGESNSIPQESTTQ